jgi:hypothetical protein
MSIHVMLDIETLGTRPDTVVLSVGACKFNPHTSQTPHSTVLWRPSAAEQLAAGRSVDHSTLEWWSQQAEHIRAEAFSDQNRISLSDFFSELNRYLVGVDKIWCQGPQFDLVILENLFEQNGHHRNWVYWQVMDCRTLFNLMPTDPRKAIQKNAHSADQDAYWQAVCVQQSYAHYEVQPR